jgi:hypothetical protein
MALVAVSPSLIVADICGDRGRHGLFAPTLADRVDL